MNKLTITLSITTLCNYNCAYCFSKNTRELQLNNKFIKFEHIIAFLTKLLAKKIQIQLIIIGGEPSLHNELPILCIFCKKMNIELIICTNASEKITYYTNLININKNIHYIFSWHSLNTNLKNIEFIKKIEFLSKILSSDSYEILVSAEPFNFNNSLNIYQTLISNIKNIQCEFNMLISTDVCKVFYTKQQKIIIDTLNQKYDFNFYEFNKNSKTNLIINNIIKNNKFNYNKWLCDSGKSYLYIDVDGFIYRCYGYFLQNINRGHITTIDISYLLDKIPQICIISKCGLDLTYTNKYTEYNGSLSSQML